MVQAVPDHGSSTRLGLPAAIEDVLIAGGEIGPFGSHQGGHMEGLDHIWFYVSIEAEVGAWASGEVLEVNESLDESWFSVVVDHGDGLTATYMELESASVEAGEFVEEGQKIGVGIEWFEGKQNAELGLSDANRNDGITGGDSGSCVSPFDYLREDVQEMLIASYEALIVQPYLEQGESIGTNSPWEPYLTNRMLFHSEYRGRLEGEWILTQTWEADAFPDYISFLPTSEYYSLIRVAGQDDVRTDDSVSFIGTIEVDYDLGQVAIYNELPATETVYYGIFSFGGTATRETMLFEWQEGSSPTTFGANAVTYIERRPVSRRQDAVDLGVRESL